MAIILDKPMSQMTLAEQEEVWRMSRTDEVFELDVNGELWQVVDCA